MAYRMRYEQGDYGTERLLTVYDDVSGQIVGQRDPFWNRSVPLTAAARNRRYQAVATEILIAADKQQTA